MFKQFTGLTNNTEKSGFQNSRTSGQTMLLKSLYCPDKIRTFGNNVTHKLSRFQLNRLELGWVTLYSTSYLQLNELSFVEVL